MTGTLVNTVAVIAGGCIGLAARKGISERVNDAVTKVLGLSTCIIGLNGVLSTMLSVTDEGRISSSGKAAAVVQPCHRHGVWRMAAAGGTSGDIG